MIRNGRAQNILQRCFCASEMSIARNPHRNLISLRYYATNDGKKGKGGKGTTAKVEECIPTGADKKIPAATNKPCPPPRKIKIPSCAPVCPPPEIRCPPPECNNICNQQPCYDACRPGGAKNPVIQGCKKPVSMKECVLPKEPPVCPEDLEKNRKRYIRNIILTLLLFALLTYGMYKYFQEDEVVPMETPKKTKKKRRKRLACKDPASSADLPKKVPYLLIGGGTAAFSAFRSIKSMDPTAQVLVVSSEFEFPYMRPPLSKEMWFNDNQEQMEKLQFKQWNGSVRSIYYEPREFYTDPATITSISKGGIAVARGWTVKKIDAYNRKVTLDDNSTITYDKCLIATGSDPISLPAFERAPESVKEMIQTYRDVFDFQDLNDIVQESNSIAVIGGGFSGSELACALARHGKHKDLKVYQIFKEPGNMGKVLPEYLSLWTMKKVEEEGVEVMPHTQVIDATVGENKLKLSLSNGKKILIDHCVVAIGAKPDTKLAEVSELEVDPDHGGYLVNAELQARSNLWVAGDAACFYDLKLGRRRIEHHDHAVVSGRLAGENMAGAGKPYWHQSMFWSDLGPEVGYEAIGIIDSKLPTVGVFAKKTEKDTPGAVVAATDSSIRSQTEEAAAPIPPAQGSPKPPEPGEDFGKGVIFYLKDDIVVGIVMWNVFNRMQIARQVLKDERKYDDLNEVAKLFNIHEE